jgi:hypothetical protein
MACNPTVPKDEPNPPHRHAPRSNNLADQLSPQLEWALAKILTQPERASVVYRRMKRRQLIGEISFMENLINIQPKQEESPPAVKAN